MQLCATLVWCLAASAGRADEGRYLATLADGSQASGGALSGWDAADALPKLDGVDLDIAGRPLRWWRDTSQPAFDPQAQGGWVEMTGGDRLTGWVTEFRGPAAATLTQSQVPGMLVVEPAGDLADSSGKKEFVIRVRADAVRRIVWSESPQIEWRPGTLFFRDGRVVSFRRLQWEPHGVRVLGDDGIERAAFTDLDEIHVPAADAWESYYDELATIVPNGTGRVIRWETAGGVMASASAERWRFEPRHTFLGRSHGPGEDGTHVVQPAWSVDPLRLPHHTLRGMTYFEPHEAPLSRIAPVRQSRRSVLGGMWRDRVDLNSHGGPLRSGEKSFGWGLGVQAFSRQEFALPPLARAFQTKVGIDDASGDGGCARARLIAASSPDRTLFASPILTGGSGVVDAGLIPLDENARRLVLQAEISHVTRPAGADPLDVRDAVDWLEPIVELDRDLLGDEIRRRARRNLPAWEGWTVDRSASGDFHFGIVKSNGGNYETGVVLESGELRLTRRLDVGDDANWLSLSIMRTTLAARMRLVLEIDDQRIADLPIPLAADRPPPLTVPLHKYRGRAVSVALVIQAGARPGALLWGPVTFLKESPALHRLFEEAIVPRDGLQLATDDPYAGNHCLRIKPRDDEAFMVVDNLNVAIREAPGVGEFRYLRFAARREGQGGMEIELIAAGPRPRRLRYMVGAVEDDEGVQVWPHETLPEWIVVTRDLFRDFGECTLGEVRVTATGEGSAFLDHGYLARDEADFQHIVTQPAVSPRASNQRATTIAFQRAIDRGKACTVVVESDGRFAGGVVISAEGDVLTAGHAVVSPGADVTITLANGRKLPAVTRGIYRSGDVALLSIAGVRDLPFMELGDSTLKPAGGLLAVTGYVDLGSTPPAAGAAVVQSIGKLNDGEWLNLRWRPSLAGAPVINREGRLIGVLSRAGRLRGSLASSSESIAQVIDRMRQADVWGRWPIDVAPSFGAEVQQVDQKLNVESVESGGPAVTAGLQVGDQIHAIDNRELKALADLYDVLTLHQPGDVLKVAVIRNAQTMTIDLTLARHPAR